MPNQKLGTSVDWNGKGTFIAYPTLGGGGSVFRTGTPTAITDVYSIGTEINVGPGINAMGTKAFSVVRGDHFIQPFAPTLDQSRTLNGEETWRATVRLDPTSSPVMTFSTEDGTIDTDGSFNPRLVFTPERFANVPVAARDVDYYYDLEMQKDGKFETYAIDNLTIRMDMSR